MVRAAVLAGKDLGGLRPTEKLRDGFRDEIVGLCAQDFHVDEFAHGSWFREDDAAVHIGGVMLGAGDIRLLYKHAEGLSCAGLRHFTGDFLLELHGLAVAAVFGASGHLIFHFRGAGAFFLRVVEYAKAFETDRFNELE